MSEAALTRERILETAAEVLRRFGPAKTTVVDVARALGVSHGSVYRHFPSKAALREAVVERWLTEALEPLQEIMEEEGPAAGRLRRWFDLLIRWKRGRARKDPGLFATYLALAAEAREVAEAHVNGMADQIAQILRDGVRQGEFAIPDPDAVARALLSATSRFHHPAHASEWREPGIDAAFEEVWSLVLQGLRAGK